MALFTNFLRFLLLLTLFPLICSAQEIAVQGKVTDAASGDPIPFVNVIFKGLDTGATTDFDGKFSIKTTKKADSIIISYIGYKTKVRAIKKGAQVINIQLEEQTTHLQEIEFNSGENPAWPILRGVVKNKDINDKRKLDSYEYDSYTKTEVDVDKISEKLRSKKVMKKIAQVLDSMDRIVGEDGKAILPLFITESVSKFYYRSNPQIKSETILKTKISGVGLDDGSVVTQLVGSTFQEYNFYLNWITIINKNFVSPIADGWRAYYDYDLIDSLYVGGDFCYRIDYYPKNPLELAFTGSMWITKKNYALKQIDASIGKESNVNFIDKIRIQQELGITEAGYWLPIKNRVLADIGEISKNSAGLLAKFYTSNKNFVVNKPHNALFYDKPIAVADDAQVAEQDVYWDSVRHEPLSEAEKSVYRMIDTIKNIPIVKTYTEVFKAVVDGYYDLGKIEVGPYVRTIAYNTVEGIRLQGGFQTNMRFSRKTMLSGYAAYGFRDTRVKVGAGYQYILSRNHWTTFNLRARRDILRLGVDEEALANNPLFLAAARWGQYVRAYYFDELHASLFREVRRGVSLRTTARVFNFDPTFPFGFYRAFDPQFRVYREITATEFGVEARWARDETFLQNGNERISLGLKRWPALSIRFTAGVKGVLGSDFSYDKIRVSLDKRIRMGFLGVGLTSVTYDHVWGDRIPYPLLNVPLGNQSPVYSPFTYNLMNFGEFVSNESFSIRHRQFFEGLLVNRIPLLNKLKWRLVGTANVIYGSLSQRNLQVISRVNERGDPAVKVYTFRPGEAYVEMGYGIENIFKFFRVDFIHRLSYLEPRDDEFSATTRKFGVFFTAQFKL